MAEDITQQSFLKALEKLDQYKSRSGATFGSWLFMIAKNELVDRQRKGGRETLSDHTDMDKELSQSSGPLVKLIEDEDDAQKKERLTKIFASMQNLKDEEREVLLLKYISGLKYKDIQKIMNKKPNTLAVLLKRSLEKIREDLDL